MAKKLVKESDNLKRKTKLISLLGQLGVCRNLSAEILHSLMIQRLSDAFSAAYNNIDSLGNALKVESLEASLKSITYDL